MEQEQSEYYPMPQNYPGHNTEGALQYQLDIDDILEELVHDIREEVKQINRETGEITWNIPKGRKPSINELGCHSVVSILRSRLKKIFALTDLDEQIIENMVFAVANNIMEDFWDNWDDYEIRDDTTASRILHLCVDLIYASYNRSNNNLFLKYLRTINTVQEVQHRNVQQVERPRQKSILERLIPFGK